MIIKFDSKLSVGLPFKCIYAMRSAVDRIKEPGSKSWTSDPSCLNLDRCMTYYCSLLVADDADPWQKVTKRVKIEKSKLLFDIPKTISVIP